MPATGNSVSPLTSTRALGSSHDGNGVKSSSDVKDDVDEGVDRTSANPSRLDEDGDGGVAPRMYGGEVLEPIEVDDDGS